MGCGSSTPQQTASSPSSGPAHSSSAGVSGGGGDADPSATTAGGGASIPKASNKAAVIESRQIDSELERARNEDVYKIKMLLLGAGESGKSTIFKQMRLLYGNANRSDEDLKMYGVVARSNIVVAMRKLVSHLRDLGLDEELDRESKNHHPNSDGGVMMTCREAYDELMAYLVENSGAASAQDPSTATTNGSGGGGGAGGENGGKTDWVGNSPRAGLAANNDAKLFLAHHKAMEVLWKVRKIHG